VRSALTRGPYVCPLRGRVFDKHSALDQLLRGHFGAIGESERSGPVELLVAEAAHICAHRGAAIAQALENVLLADGGMSGGAPVRDGPAV